MDLRPGVLSREVQEEMRKVAWPTEGETTRHALAVGLTLVLMATLIVVADAASGYAISRFFGG